MLNTDQENAWRHSAVPVLLIHGPLTGHRDETSNRFLSGALKSSLFEWLHSAAKTELLPVCQPTHNAVVGLTVTPAAVWGRLIPKHWPILHWHNTGVYFHRMMDIDWCSYSEGIHFCVSSYKWKCFLRDSNRHWGMKVFQLTTWTCPSSPIRWIWTCWLARV